MKKKKWITKYQKEYGQKTIPIDFEKFMRHYELTVEELVVVLCYSKQGVVSMLSRGTVKRSVFDLLAVHYSDIYKYIKKVK